MKRGAIGIIVTVLFATAAAASVFMYVRSAREHAEGVREMTEVIVATVDVPANQELDPLLEQGVFEMKAVPTEDLIQGVLTQAYQLKGQRTAYPILAGEQITAARLQGSLQAGGGLHGIGPGMHAVSVTLEGQRAVSGLLREGDHVEVFGTFRKTSSDAWITQILVVDARVLDVVRESEAAGDAKATIMLEVSPEDAQMVIYGQEQGRVWLTLLPPNEAGVELPPLRSVSAR